MWKRRAGMMALLSLSFALPAFAMTYKSSYFNPRSEVWVTVKDVHGNPESHSVVQNDEAKMRADYEAKHAAHVNISGTVLQRPTMSPWYRRHQGVRYRWCRTTADGNTTTRVTSRSERMNHWQS